MMVSWNGLYMASLVKKLFVMFLVCHDLRQIGTNQCDSFQRDPWICRPDSSESRRFLNWSMVGLLKVGGKLTTERVKPCSHGRSFTTFHKTFLYLEHTSFQIYSSSNLLQSAEVETLQSSSCTKSGGDPTFLTKHSFGIEHSVPEGSFVIDKAGTKQVVGEIRIAVAVHVENVIPVDLQHAQFKDMQIAYGTLMV